MPDYLDFAINTAKKAGKILMKHYGRIEKVEYKHQAYFKTIADDESEEFIRKEIRKSYPSHNIYAEEGKNEEHGSEYSWVIDPLDGTIPYTFQTSDHFSVCIALIKGKTPILGVIYAPARNELYVAELGKGAFLNGKKISVSSGDDITKAMVGMDYGKTGRWKLTEYQKKLLADDGIMYNVCFGCASLPLAFVAMGKIGAYLSLSLEPWDMAAAVIINREAGAKVTDFYGKSWEFGDGSILTANNSLHSKLLALMQK